jgi:hypothetical protein
MDLRYQLIVPARGDLPLAMARQEKWTRLEDGQWYRQIKKKGFPGAQGEDADSAS